MKKQQLKVANFILLILLIIPFSFHAIEAEKLDFMGEPGKIVVKINNLDPFIYAEIVKAFEGNQDYEVSLACVPVDLIYFTKKNESTVTNEAMFDTIKLIIEGSSNADVVILTDHDKESFDQTCAAARHGRP